MDFGFVSQRDFRELRADRIEDSTFYNVIWVVVSISVVLLLKFEALNQIILKGLVPVTFLLVWFDRKRRIVNSRPIVYYIIFTAWGFLSVFYTANLDITVKYLQVLVGNVVLWIIVDNCVRGVKSPLILSAPIVFSCLSHLYFGISMSTETISNRDDAVARVSGLSGNANGLAFYFWYGASLVILLSQYIKSKRIKIISYTLVPVFVYGILITGSRKTTIALLVFFIVYITLNIKRQSIVILLLLLVVGYFVSDFFIDMFISNSAVGQRFSSEDVERGAVKRADLIGEGWEFFWSNPLIGIGLGSFITYSKYRAMSHNDYIEILSTMGLPAFIIYIAIYIEYFKKCLQVSVKRFRSVFLAFIIGFLFLGMGRPAFLDPLAMAILAFWSAMLDRTINNNEIKQSNENLPYYKYA